MNDESPDLGDLYIALDTMEAALASGMKRGQPSGELLEKLRAISAARAGAATQVCSVVQAGAAATAEPALPDPAVPTPTLAALEAKALACTACPLSAGRKNVVFGQGVATPTVLIVGEGPGAEEDRQGQPFVGASGQLLDKMLASIGLSRNENCYIANVVKCRPPNNREPAPDEKASCMPYLREQIGFLAPKAILCAGRTAAQALLATTEGINRLRNRTLEYNGIPVVATFHPSALLRDETLKRPAWEDLKRLRDLLAETPGRDD
jgi:DNA polymerase